MLLFNILEKSDLEKHIKDYDLIPEHLECQMCMTNIQENNHNNKNGYVYHHYDELVCNNQECKIEWYEFHEKQERDEIHRKETLDIVQEKLREAHERNIEAHERKQYQEFKKEQMSKY